MPELQLLLLLLVFPFFLTLSLCLMLNGVSEEDKLREEIKALQLLRDKELFGYHQSISDMSDTIRGLEKAVKLLINCTDED